MRLVIEAFAGRAERELLATGKRVRKPTVETRDELTAQEAQVARLARDGLSNAEPGARLFISQHAVAYHLRKIFNKLGIPRAANSGGSCPTGRREWSSLPTPAREITGWRRRSRWSRRGRRTGWRHRRRPHRSRTGS